MTAERKVSERRFLWLFALAWAGGSIAYVPFLTILLPLRVIDIAGGDSVRILGFITFSGAVAASCGNILFGWLSDRSGRRRPWVAAGLALITILLVSVSFARTVPALLALIVCWQLALNMMLGPLSAWAADQVPMQMTGRLGGLVALSPAFGALSGVIATMPGLAGPDQRLVLVAGLVLACVAPAVLVVRSDRSPRPESDTVEARPRRRFAVAMWIARLLMQVAEAALFAYLLLYFRSLEPGIDESRVARLFCLVVVSAVPIAILAGRWSDRHRRPFLPLAICALLSAVGLVTMAASASLSTAEIGYACFSLSMTVFLSLHSGQTLRVLPSPRHRGRDLGLFNLTNTIPSLIMPWLTLAIVPRSGFAGLFLMLAGIAAVSAALLLAISRLEWFRAESPSLAPAGMPAE